MNSHSGFIPNGLPVQNEYGHSATISTDGRIDLTNEFFQDLGSNGRRCVSCHQPSAGWSITPEDIQNAFDDSDGGLVGDDFGLSAVFRLNDGSVSPNADVSTLANRRAAFSMLLTKGLIRVGIGIPNNAEFTLDAVDDPYGFATAAELSLFRRPLPATNLPFLPTIMWDGRETLSGTDMRSNLAHQALDATLGHAQATATDPAQIDSIVAFESSLFTAQTLDHGTGPLDKHGGKGGPQNLANTPFFIGINDSLSPGFDPNAMTLYDGFAPPASAKSDSASVRRYAIYRGQQIFNTRQFAITGVGGLNDMLGQPTIMGTCTTCHDTPNVGNHSVSLALDIGVADASRRTPDMPLYTLRNKTTGATVQTTDPGRALITGKWADIGKFKGPVLRGLQMRPPFFHNGMAATLEDVVAFYNSRFSIGLTAQERSDLLAFLQAL